VGVQEQVGTAPDMRDRSSPNGAQDDNGSSFMMFLVYFKHREFRPAFFCGGAPSLPPTWAEEKRKKEPQLKVGGLWCKLYAIITRRVGH
jgi:hypothetical protein